MSGLVFRRFYGLNGEIPFFWSMVATLVCPSFNGLLSVRLFISSISKLASLFIDVEILTFEIPAFAV